MELETLPETKYCQLIYYSRSGVLSAIGVGETGRFPDEYSLICGSISYRQYREFLSTMDTSNKENNDGRLPLYPTTEEVKKRFEEFLLT